MAFVAYYRVSTDKQGRSGLGLEAQRKAVESHIGGPTQHEFVEIESGKRSNRPELVKALDLAELTNATLIVAKLDRLSRDAEFLHRLLKHKVKIVFADMPFADKMVISVMAALAEWEREQISKRTKAALEAAKARGTQLGGDRGNLGAVRSRGVRASAESRAKNAQDRNVKVMAQVAAARDAGHLSVRSIAAFLNERGIKTARGGEWLPGSVHRLIGNAVGE
jgi:DNA invertase Pin-like site-specific DNA recombinase